MVQAMNRQLDVSFELTQEITELSTDLLTLSRVLGIFLDNAIEAASETEQKRFHIAIVCKVHSVIFHIENSTKPLLFPLEELFKPSISSKEAQQRSWTSHRKYADRQCAGADLQHDLRKRSF